MICMSEKASLSGVAREKSQIQESGSLLEQVVPFCWSYSVRNRIMGK